MAGDGITEVSIPSAFLFTKEAKIVLACVSDFMAEGTQLEVLIGSKQKSLGEFTTSSVLLSEVSYL